MPIPKLLLNQEATDCTRSTTYDRVYRKFIQSMTQDGMWDVGALSPPIRGPSFVRSAGGKTANALFHGSGALLVGPATPGYPKPPGLERLTEIPGECQKPGLAHGRQ